MAQKSVLPAIDMEAKAPFNKNLVLIVVFVALLLVGLAALLGSQAGTGAEAEKPVDAVPFTQGTARDVDSEWAAFKTSPRGGEEPAVLPPEINPNATDSNTKNERHHTATDELNHPKEDHIAQAAVSSLSIVDGVETKPSAAVLPGLGKTAEQLIAELAPQRLTEKEAFEKSAAMTAALHGGALPGGVDAGNSLAAKTKRFMNEQPNNSSSKVLRKNSAPGEWVVTAGKTIPALTRRAQNSDLPCAIEATTSVDVYDSYTSTRLLIPKGSEVIGVCSNDIAYGQDRILSLFTRLILPNGEYFNLENSVGMDRTGATGMRGTVDNHFLEMFASSLLIAAVAYKADSSSNANAGNSMYMNSQAGAKSAAGQVAVDVGEHVLGRYKQMQPTIDVGAGRRIYIQVKHDMVFD